MDSVLGEHSADFGDLEAAADHQSCSTPKSPKNYESPTAMPRIREEKQAKKSTQPLESTFPYNAHCVIASFAKQSAAIHTESTFENEDSRDNAKNVKTPQNKQTESVFDSESRRQDF